MEVKGGFLAAGCYGKNFCMGSRSQTKVFVSKFAFPARRSAAPEKLLGLGAPLEPSLLLWLGHHIGL